MLDGGETKTAIFSSRRHKQKKKRNEKKRIKHLTSEQKAFYYLHATFQPLLITLLIPSTIEQHPSKS